MGMLYLHFSGILLALTAGLCSAAAASIQRTPLRLALTVVFLALTFLLILTLP